MAGIDAPAELASDPSDERIRAELRRISAAPDFVRAPVMRRLLEFLVGETLAGRGDQLKAYSVAVDGLGRPADFDAQADSYPRVQVGRLRRMLDALYARDPGDDRLRLTIPQGRYRVRFTEIAPDAEASPADPPGWKPAHAIALIGLLILLLAMILAVIGAHGPAAPKNIRPEGPPTLALAHLRADPRHDALEIDADAILLDGLRRTWLVSVAPQPSAANAPYPVRATYLLGGEIAGVRQLVARLRLVRVATGEVIWTGQSPLPADRTQLRDAFDPLIAELIQPYGVIATDQRSLLSGTPKPGYPCLLRFDQYRRERQLGLHRETRACVERTLALEPLNAMALAADAYLTLDDELYHFSQNSGDSRGRALMLARRAVAADPYSAFAHIVLARAARHNGSCRMTIQSARRAMVLNRNDPDIHAMAGTQLYFCGDPGAEAAARRAIALDPSPPASFYSPLVFLALDRGDIAGARHLTQQMMPSPDVAPGFYDMIFAVVAAAAGDGAGAKAAWARMGRVDPALARDPTTIFRRWSLPARVERKSLGYLRDVGVIPPAPPAPPAPAR